MTALRRYLRRLVPVFGSFEEGVGVWPLNGGEG